MDRWVFLNMPDPSMSPLPSQQKHPLKCPTKSSALFRLAKHEYKGGRRRMEATPNPKGQSMPASLKNKPGGQKQKTGSQKAREVLGGADLVVLVGPREDWSI